MNFAERKDYRLKLLTNLYDYHFKHRGVALMVEEESMDDETFLGYRYLREHDLIRIEPGGKSRSIYITASGIDLIENS